MNLLITEDTTPGSDSLVYTTDAPGGTPVDRKVTIANFGKGLTIVSNVTGIYKGSSGTVSAASAGTDYENPLTFNAPLGRATNAISFTCPGSDTQVMFNDGGTVLGGDAGLVYNKTTKTLTFNKGVIGNVTDTSTSGIISWLSITPTYNQTSGTASNLDFVLNRTETAIGSGTQKLMSLQIAGAEKLGVYPDYYGTALFVDNGRLHVRVAPGSAYPNAGSWLTLTTGSSSFNMCLLPDYNAGTWVLNTSPKRFILDGSGQDVYFAVGGPYTTYLLTGLLELRTGLADHEEMKMEWRNHTRILTTDATVTTIATIALDDESTYRITYTVIGRCTGGAGGNAGKSCSFVRSVTFRRTGAGIATLVGANPDLLDYIARDVIGWDATAVISTNSILISVTGAATDNITWNCIPQIQRLTSAGD